jgi:hypothetical protein
MWKCKHEFEVLNLKYFLMTDWEPNLWSCFSIHMLVTTHTPKEKVTTFKLFSKADIKCDLRVINMKTCNP